MLRLSKWRQINGFSGLRMGWRQEGNRCGKTRGSLLWVLVMRERFHLDCISVDILVVTYVCKMSSPGGNGQRVHRISLSLLFSQDYIRLHHYLNRKDLIKKKNRLQPEKKMETSHTVQMHSFYLRRTISRPCPLGKASLIIRYIKINHYSRQGTKIHASVTSIQ